jgi:septum formation protein
MELLLGSNSPRRAQLLNEMGYTFTKVSINCDESFDVNLPLHQVAPYLAQKKSEAYSVLMPQQILITADTVVINQDQLLNKPTNREEAVAMLSSLSGANHTVQTGLCLRSTEKTILTSVTTTVYVDKLSAGEIAFYVDTYNPLDKAGAYGIQEWFGLARISKIEGCYYNVVGLPCNELYKRLKNDYEI